MTTPAYLNATAAARAVGVNERTVRRWIKAGRLKAIPQGRELIVRLADVQRLAGVKPTYRRIVGRLYWRSSSSSDGAA